MKKSYLIFLIIGTVFTSCFKTELPPILEYSGPPANISIAEFQKLHTLNTDSATLITKDIIISGIVTSTDKYGSSFKEMFIQDTSGGISIRIDNSSYYKKYPIGQRIFVHANGLHLGNYVSGYRYGFYQIAMSYGKGLMYIPSKAESQHIFLSSRQVEPTTPKIITTINNIKKGRGGDYHTLVKLENCYFEAANGTTKYFEKTGTSTTISRVIKFSDGTGPVEARISEFCTFANDILPKGSLSITGILTMFGTNEQSTPQLIICDVNKVEFFKDLVSVDMTTNPFNEGWSCKKIIGDIEWKYDAGFKNVYIQPSGSDSECWFVSPKFNFAGKKDIELIFNYRVTNNGTEDNFCALYSLDGTNWNLFDFIPQPNQNYEAKIKLDNNIATKPNFQIAFKYKTTNIYPMAELTKIIFRDNVK